jgi:prevent-host-death family protein
MKVGIRELKANLSRYVKAAHDGQLIVVTDRGVPVAVLAPPPMDDRDDLPPALRQLIRDGRATAPARVMRLSPVAPARASRSVQDILDEDRGV